MNRCLIVIRLVRQFDAGYNRYQNYRPWIVVNSVEILSKKGPRTTLMESGFIEFHPAWDCYIVRFMLNSNPHMAPTPDTEEEEVYRRGKNGPKNTKWRELGVRIWKWVREGIEPVDHESEVRFWKEIAARVLEPHNVILNLAICYYCSRHILKAALLIYQ